MEIQNINTRGKDALSAEKGANETLEEVRGMFKKARTEATLYHNDVFIAESHLDLLKSRLKEHQYNSKKDEESVDFIVNEVWKLYNKKKKAPRAVNTINKPHKDRDEGQEREKQLIAQVEELTGKLGKKCDAKDEAGEEQAAVVVEPEEQVSSLRSLQEQSGEAQSGEGMHQGSKGSPRVEQLTMAQQPPVHSLIESSMPREIKSCDPGILGHGEVIDKVAWMVAELWEKVFGSQVRLQNGEGTD